MRYKRLQGLVFLIIGIFPLSAIVWLLCHFVVPDLLAWVLAAVVAVCGLVNIACGLALVRK